MIRVPKSESHKLPERNITSVLTLYETLVFMKRILCLELESLDFAFFQHIQEMVDLEKLDTLLDKLSGILSEDVVELEKKRKGYSSQNTRCYAVKEGVDVLLDVGTQFVLKQLTHC